MLQMVKRTLEILRCSHRKIFKVSLTILQHYEKRLVFKGNFYYPHPQSLRIGSTSWLIKGYTDEDF